MMTQRKKPRTAGGIGVIIAAGGKGKRMGGSIPKQFLRLEGRTILERTLDVFTGLPGVAEIIVVVPEGYVEKSAWIIHGGNFPKVSRVIAGGKDRQESVWNGLRAFHRPPKVVLIHDAVRPLVHDAVVREVVRQARRLGSAVVGVKVKDTIKWEGRPGFSTRTLDRTRLWAVQTPQGFLYDLLFDAHRRARKAGFVGTDDASLVERLGKRVKLVEGDYENLKITTEDDLHVAAMVLKARRGM